MSIPIDRILSRKRDGHALTTDEIEAFVTGVVDGSVSRPQAAAWLSFSFVRGLDQDETVALTRSMTHSGDVMSWQGIPGPFIDKHSTGGVGDKISLILAPLWAELGFRVPMISGRGLEFTGGTLDKLESIPGFRTDLQPGELRRMLLDVGCFISGQTGDVAPADRVLYALRNETCNVPSIPLITGSILSKKLAEGTEELVLDVKVGSGAFMKDLEQARALAESLVRVGKGAGLRVRALLTDMSQPCGTYAGNALEVIESIEVLQGGGPTDVRELTLRLAGDPRAAEILDSGRALERFHRMVEAQGGDTRLLDDPWKLVGDVQVEDLTADRDGYVTRCDAWQLGMAAFRLGAGRSRAEDPVLPGVGLGFRAKRGDRVRKGEPLVRIYHVGCGLDAARELARQAYGIGDQAPEAIPMVLDVID